MALAALAAGAIAAAAAPASAASAVYALDPERSFVHFEVLHFGTSTIHGRFGPIRGHVRMDPAAGTGEIGVEIDVASVSTGFPAFDARLRRPDLLATDAHPRAWFVARRFRFSPDGRLQSVHGELTLREVSQGLELNALRYACVTDPASGRERCGGDFEGHIDRSTIGASFGLPFVGDRVRLRLSVDGLREP